MRDKKIISECVIVWAVIYTIELLLGSTTWGRRNTNHAFSNLKEAGYVLISKIPLYK